nr:hypothetical protein [Tanacetum cinerariifolium]
MSTNEQTPVSQPTSIVRNTLGKEQVLPDLSGPAFDAALRERKGLKERLGSKHVCSMSRIPKPRRDHFKSPRKREFAYEKHHNKRASLLRREAPSERKDGAGGHWKSKPKRQRSSVEDDLSQPWVYEETDPFTPRISRSQKEAKLQEGRLPKPTKVRAKAGHIHPSHKNTKRNPGFGQREVQASSSNDNPGRKRNASKFCKFHRDVGHTTDECMHLKRKIEEMLISGKLSHLIKELKKSSRKDQAMAAKKEETLRKEKPLAIHHGREDETEGPMIIEAEMGGHFVHRMYIDGGSSLEVLYEHCFNRFHPEVRSHMIPATSSLVRFSGKIIWPLGQISIFVKIGDGEHSTSAWMNFMVVRSPSPYNGKIKRPKVRRIQAVPSTDHEMLKFLMAGGTITLRSSRIIPLEYMMVSGPRVPQPVINQVTKEKIQVAIHPEYPEQTIAIGSTLTKEGRKELCGLLRRNLDIFSWKPADMTRLENVCGLQRLEHSLSQRWLSAAKKRLKAPAVDSAANVLAEWNAIYDAYNKVACHILWSMTPELHRKFKNSSPYDMIKELKSMFKKQAGVERFDLIQTFPACKQEEGKSIAEYVKDKQVYIPKPKKPKPAAKENPAKDDTCHHCKEVGHWKKNCLVYLAKLLKKQKLVGTASSSGNGVRVQVESIRNYELVLPNGLVICLDNCHYAPSITRGKHNLDSTYLWHYRLAYTSKKCIEKMKQEGILKSTDDELFDQCVFCLSIKMTRKSFPHHHKRATDLLGIIYTDVCDLLRHVSRQGASYFITFMDDDSRYGYVYLLKHKHEDYALESATRILNMVPTKKVDKTPYELCGRAIDLEEIQDKDTSPSKITSKIPMEVEDFKPPQEEVILIRRSKRIHRAPNRLFLNVEVEEHSLGDLNEPTNYKAAILDPEPNKWLEAMNAEIQSMIDNMVWVLVDLPPKCKTVETKSYTQLYGADYEETFSPVTGIIAIRILISIVTFYDYEIWQMDVKIAFLNGYLDEDIYMVQLEGFVDPNHPRKICFFVYGGNPKVELQVDCYCDARFETDRDDTKSHTGYVFTLNKGAMDWKSSKQSTTAMSATEAEYIAALDG